jgi:hypothetical protein
MDLMTHLELQYGKMDPVALRFQQGTMDYLRIGRYKLRFQKDVTTSLLHHFLGLELGLMVYFVTIFVLLHPDYILFERFGWYWILFSI